MESTNTTTGKRTLVSFDYATKRLLRNKANYEVLEGFLSELLERNVTVKNIGESESNKTHKTDKSNKVDVFVEDKKGEIILIELQFTIEMDYLHRMLYGVSKTISEYMSEGKKYMNVKKVYSVNIVYFNLGHGEDYIYHGKTHFLGKHNRDELQMTKVQRNTFGKETAGDIFPEYYVLKIDMFNNVAKDKLDEWIYFFKNSEIKDSFTAKGLDKAREVLKYEKLSPEERKEYDQWKLDIGENKSQVESSRDEGIEIGKEIGEKKGKKEGLKKGKEEGLAEGMKKVKEEKESVVINSFKNGLTLELISSITSLTQEEVTAILKKHGLI